MASLDDAAVKKEPGSTLPAPAYPTAESEPAEEVISFGSGRGPVASAAEAAAAEELIGSWQRRGPDASATDSHGRHEEHESNGHGHSRSHHAHPGRSHGQAGDAKAMTELFGHYADEPRRPARRKAKAGHSDIDPGLDHATGALGAEDYLPVDLSTPVLRKKCKVIEYQEDGGAVKIHINPTSNAQHFIGAEGLVIASHGNSVVSFSVEDLQGPYAVAHLRGLSLHEAKQHTWVEVQVQPKESNAATASGPASQHQGSIQPS